MSVKTLLSGKIQNGRHEIIKVIISLPIIEIHVDTSLFHQTICFRYQGMHKTNDTFI